MLTNLSLEIHPHNCNFGRNFFVDIDDEINPTGFENFLLIGWSHWESGYGVESRKRVIEG